MLTNVTFSKNKRKINFGEYYATLNECRKPEKAKLSGGQGAQTLMTPSGSSKDVVVAS